MGKEGSEIVLPCSYRYTVLSSPLPLGFFSDDTSLGPIILRCRRGPPGSDGITAGAEWRPVGVLPGEEGVGEDQYREALVGGGEAGAGAMRAGSGVPSWWSR